jgi:predicted permease
MEVAASLTLLAGSALMLRSVVALLQVDLGFDARRVLNASLTLRQNRYPDSSSRVAIFDRMMTRVGAVPGVESVGLTNVWPVQQPGSVPVETAGTRRSGLAAVHGVSDGYFETLGIPLVGGRAFTRDDRVGSGPVAMVSDSLARRLWPSGDALGSRIAIPQNEEQQSPVQRLVIGVVRDVRQHPADEDGADIYVPMRQTPSRFAFVLVRTAGAPAASLEAVRSALHDIDPELALDRARPMQLAVDEITSRPRFMGSLLGAFALVAAALALVGVYGVIAYAVRQREREIAVRLALGAEPAVITRSFVRQGGVIIGIGLAVGVLTTLAAGRLIESQLFAVTPRDPVALSMAVGAFGVAGLLAVWRPARRAAATDPSIALKVE